MQRPPHQLKTKIGIRRKKKTIFALRNQHNLSEQTVLFKYNKISKMC